VVGLEPGGIPQLLEPGPPARLSVRCRDHAKTVIGGGGRGGLRFVDQAEDRADFETAIEDLFSSRGRSGHPDTRAVLLIHRGRLVYERYADGFGERTRFQSWSMAKSITNAFVGLLVGDGRLELDAPAPVDAWRAEGDPRGDITLRHLLQMRSGLDNADGFGAGDMTHSFVARLLFSEGALAPADYAANVELAHAVGERWAYSTGTSVLLAGIAGRQLGGGRAATRDYLRARLFEPIGMTSATPEFAASGEYVGGAFFHARARDWARFGYLYLRDGVWDGERILPSGWVDFSRRASPAANNGIHGAHFWVNREPGPDQWVQLPGAPATAFSAEGASFQMIAIVPTMDLVAVRLGEAEGADFQTLRRKFARVITLFPEIYAVDGAPLAIASTMGTGRGGGRDAGARVRHRSGGGPRDRAAGEARAPRRGAARPRRALPTHARVRRAPRGGGRPGRGSVVPSRRRGRRPPRRPGARGRRTGSPRPRRAVAPERPPTRRGVLLGPSGGGPLTP